MFTDVNVQFIISGIKAHCYQDAVWRRTATRMKCQFNANRRTSSEDGSEISDDAFVGLPCVIVGSH